MKNLKTLSTLFVLAVAVLTMSSCNKTEFVEGGDVDFNISMKVGANNFVPGETYMINETVVQFDVISLYLGGIEFTAEGGAVTSIEDKYLLVNSESANYSVGDLSDDVYKKVDFFIGIADAENSQTEEDFTTRSSGDPLGVQDPAMHWNWNSGYKFLRIDGMVDTDGDGTVDAANAYHIGTNALRTALSFDIPEKVDNNTLEFVFDLQDLFAGIDLATETTTHTANNMELAQKVVANYDKALKIQK